MNVNLHFSEILREDYTTVQVQLNENSRSLYTYKVLKSQAAELRPGKLVLVPHPKSNQAQAPKGMPAYVENGAFEVDSDSIENNEFPHVKAGIVARVDAEPRVDYGSTIQYKWIVGVLDMGQYRKNLEEDELLKGKIQEARIQQMRNNARAALLESNPEIKGLLG